MTFSRKALGLTATAVVVLGACTTTGGGASASAGASGGDLTDVRFHLKWVAQTQFAGYFAAVEQGYYREAGLDVTLILGGPNINEVQVTASGGADLGTTWLPSMLQSREGGTDLVSIAQIFQRSGTRMASFKDADITSPADMEGKNVGSWLLGNEPELFAALTKAGLNPEEDANIIKQNFDMSGLLSGDLDTAQAMIYNEYAQVLEARNPDTGELYQPEDLDIVDFNDPSVGTAMLQDLVFARDSWLKEGNNADVATRFLTGSYRGWIYCRDNQQACVDLVLAEGSQLGASHQAWQMNEINALIWPSPNGIGTLDPAAWDQTVDIATTYGVLVNPPSDGAFRTDLAAAALAALPSGTDANGASFQKQTVTLNEGGN
jgi:NitT/TauT family transport system substrate-binding protein